jgi:CRISPR-associated endonuclease Cas2
MFKYVLIYDVQEDSLRTKVQKLVEESGLSRLQYSVYAGNIRRETLENLILELKWLVKDEIADVRVIYPCFHSNFPIRTIIDNYPPQPAEIREDNVYIP